VDIHGLSIGEEDTQTVVEQGSTYSKTIPPIIGYASLGYKWNSTPIDAMDYSSGDLFEIEVSDNAEIYLIYYEIRSTTLTISKRVAGTMANKTTMFEFTVGIYDNAGMAYHDAEYKYVIVNASGATIAADTLTLSHSGEWTFHIKHGESLIISDILADDYFRVIEDDYADYEASFIDSKDTTSTLVISKDTTLLGMDGTPRTITFTNERIIVPVTGIANPGSMLILTMLALCVLICLMFLRRKRRSE